MSFSLSDIVRRNNVRSSAMSDLRFLSTEFSIIALILSGCTHVCGVRCRAGNKIELLGV